MGAYSLYCSMTAVGSGLRLNLLVAEASVDTAPKGLPLPLPPATRSCCLNLNDPAAFKGVAGTIESNIKKSSCSLKRDGLI
jgi:hypothetical protein